MAAKIPTAGKGRPPGELDLGLRSLNTDSSGKPQGVKSPHHRLPPPWRSIGEIVAETIERIARVVP
jgi:hypothetical protein